MFPAVGSCGKELLLLVVVLTFTLKRRGILRIGVYRTPKLTTMYVCEEKEQER